MTTEIYTPPNCKTLEHLEVPQIRMGIQGFPGTGKTWGALTFPFPTVLDIDKGLGAHKGRADVIQVPLLDLTYAATIYREEPSNLREVILQWLRKEGPKLTKDQTCILDGLTGTEFAFHKNFKPVISVRSGKIDEFAEWQMKVEYFNEITETVKRLRCNFILISHEAERPDKPTTIGQPGEYTGKIRPLITGQYRDRIVGQFTDWFRQHASSKPDFNKLTDTQTANIKNWWGMTVPEYQAMCDTFPRNTIYYWETESNDLFDGKCSSLVNFPRFIPANYTSFIKYLRK